MRGAKCAIVLALSFVCDVHAQRVTEWQATWRDAKKISIARPESALLSQISRAGIPAQLSEADPAQLQNKETSSASRRVTDRDLIGNRVGQEHDWVKPGEFQGKRILIACYYLPGNRNWKMYENVTQVLRDVGFVVDARYMNSKLPDLEPYDQCWIISGDGRGSRFGKKDVQAIRRFLSQGKGVYVLADNSPYFYEASVVSRSLHKTAIAGDYRGFQVIHVVRGLERVSPKRSASLGNGRLQGLGNSGRYYAADHELLSGLDAIYEGQTISHLWESRKLHVVLRASNNLPLVAVSRNDKERIVYDCGFTRMYASWKKHEVSSTRWFQNVAGYLMGKTRADLRRTEQGSNRKR